MYNRLTNTEMVVRVYSIRMFALFFLCISSAFASDYNAVNKAAANYLIAAVGYDVFKSTQCGYSVESSNQPPLSKIEAIIYPKLTPDDRIEMKDSTKAIRTEIRPNFDRTYAQLISKTDHKTACGMLAGQVLRSLSEAKSQWVKVTAR